jgi:predicted dehydrogenase
MPQEPVRVGIAGLGRSGWDIHANLLAPLTEHYRVVAVVDAAAERRAEAIERFDCQAYTGYDELLADPAVELVVVALPSFLHADATIAAFALGKHVVCEKPMAVSLAEADAMIGAARQHDRVLTIFQQRRYEPAFVKVQEIIASGILGRIVQIRLAESRFGRRWDWQTLQMYGGGSLNNTGPHFMDQALQLFGPAEPQVTCCLDRTLTLGDADDHVKILLQAPGAPTLDIEIFSSDAYPPPTWHVVGTQGGLTGTPRRLEWKWVAPAEMPPRTLDTRPTPDRSYNRDALTWHQDTWEYTGRMEDAWSTYYLDLFATLRAGAPLKITPESIRRVMWLQQECHRLAPLPQTIP